MNKPLLLDLFCGAGGAARGYQLAGFYVVGVDIKPQPRYAGDLFIQMDALEFARKWGRGVDAIHASPPCQRHTVLNNIKKIKASTDENYIDLIPETRELLIELGKPYVIENVKRNVLDDPVMVCGSWFPELRVYRHRFFESNIMLLTRKHEPHNDNTPPAGQGVSDKGFVSITAGGLKKLPPGWTSPAAYKNMAMGIDWMIQNELREAIPPQYTKYIGQQLIRAV